MRNRANISDKYPPSRPPEVIPVCCKISIKPEPVSLHPLLGTYIYVWLKNEIAFWMFPVKLIENLLCGYMFANEKWEAICISCDLIKSFY